MSTSTSRSTASATLRVVMSSLPARPSSRSGFPGAMMLSTPAPPSMSLLPPSPFGASASVKPRRPSTLLIASAPAPRSTCRDEVDRHSGRRGRVLARSVSAPPLARRCPGGPPACRHPRCPGGGRRRRRRTDGRSASAAIHVVVDGVADEDVAVCGSDDVLDRKECVGAVAGHRARQVAADACRDTRVVHEVDAGAAVERVVAGPPDQRVGAVCTGEPVGPVAADQVVIARAPLGRCSCRRPVMTVAMDEPLTFSIA